MFISLAGTLLLARLDVNSGNNDVLLAMLVLGLGMGFGMALYTLVVQNALPTKIGQATSALTFFRSIGGTVALAIMGSVMNTAYLPAFRSALPTQATQLAAAQPHFAQALGAFNNPQVLLQPGLEAQMQAGFAQAHLQGLFNQIIEAVKLGLTQGIHNVFILSVVIMAIGTICVFFLKEIPLRGRSRKQEETPEIEGSLVATL
jgi:hypothetical protein